MLTAPGYSAFMERPDNTLNGMTDYYEIITKPMWLKEGNQIDLNKLGICICLVLVA